MDNSSSRRGSAERVRQPSGAAGELEVYPPREDTYLLLPYAAVHGGTTFAEVGAGSGVASLRAAAGGARVVATDLNWTALAHLRRSARQRALALEVVRTDLLRGQQFECQSL